MKRYEGVSYLELQKCWKLGSILHWNVQPVIRRVQYQQSYKTSEEHNKEEKQDLQ